MKQQLLNKLTTQLERALEHREAVKEATLFITFCNLSPAYQPKESDLAQQILGGQLSLSQGYQALANNTPEFKQLFELSKLPTLLSDVDVKTYINEVKQVTAQGESWSEALREHHDKLGKGSSTHTLAPELLSLMAALCLGGQKVASTYLPFTASSQFVETVKEHSAEVFCESSATENFLCASTLINGVKCQISDPLEAPGYLEVNGALKQFSRVLMVPPFGLKTKYKGGDPLQRFPHPTANGDVLTLLHGIAQCSERLVTVMPLGFLFRGAADKYCREMLVEQGILEAIIQLPGGMFSTTAIPTCLIIIDKNRNPQSPVLFYNADHKDFVRPEKRGMRKNIFGWQSIVTDVLNRQANHHGLLADASTIKANDYDFSVSRYVLSEASQAMQELANTQPLTKVAELIRAQLLKEVEDGQGETFLEVGIKDVSSSGVATRPAKTLTLSGKSRDRANLQRLQPGDILLTIKGNVGKVALVAENCEENWVAGQIFQVIRLRAPSHILAPEYLFRYLASHLVQQYFQDNASGSAISVLKTSDIKNLPVPILPETEQQQVMHTHKQILEAHERVVEIQHEIQELSSNHWNVSTN